MKTDPKFEDVAGKTLREGDRVVTTNGNYAELQLGKVTGFTPKMVRLELDHGYPKTVTKFPNQIAIILK